MRKTVTRFRQFITPFSSIRHKKDGVFEEKVPNITRFGEVRHPFSTTPSDF
jgi:hypothetical protein